MKNIREFDLDILDICEYRWTGTGKSVTAHGAVIIHSGTLKTFRGWRSYSRSKRLKLYWNVNERIITARLRGRNCKITIVQCYAPTNDADYVKKDDFNDQLQQVLDKVA